jgi:hypothetical protein
MKTGMLARLAALLLLGSAAAHAGVTDFHGHWENTARDAGGLTHVVISPDGGNRVNVRMYGNCHPVECDWGMVPGKGYSADPHSKAVDSIAAVISAGFARRQIVFRAAAGGRLQFEMLTDFPDGSGWHDFVVRGTLKQSTWAGPITENWERPAGTGTGWGGGVPGAALSRPQESCKAFDFSAVRVVRQNGTWRVVAGPQALVESGDKHVALAAETTIKYFRFDRRCFVGGPAYTYWRRGSSFPQQMMGSADCFTFSPTTAHVARIGRSWKIVDGSLWISEFGEDKNQADAMLSLIRFHRLDTQCVVGRPNPVMVYWLSG